MFSIVISLAIIRCQRVLNRLENNTLTTRGVRFARIAFGLVLIEGLIVGAVTLLLFG